MEKKHRPLDGFYHKIMTPSNARKAKSALPMPLREANTSDAALMKNKKIKRKNKNKKNKNKNKEAHACDVIFQTVNQLGQCSRKRPKMDENRVFPTNQVNMELFNLFTTSESPKIRIRIDQIFCYDFFNDSATNNLRQVLY